MNTRADILEKLTETKIVAIIRMNDNKKIFQIADALYQGGIVAIEVTMGTPNAIEEIRKLSDHEGILPGVGSVTNVEMAEEAINAGAQFVVTPTSREDIIKVTHVHNKPILSGALTPTEILQAYEWGADVIKLFPAATFGLSYFKAVKAPMPYIPIMPTGGVDTNNASAWIQAGAVCLGVGSSLVDKSLIAMDDYQVLTERARLLRNAVDG